jgi:hypothetical protein
VSGRLPNTTNSSNTQYIDAGEFAVNLADSKVISSNGTVTFEVGANLTTSYISSNVSIGGITLINTTAMSTNNIYTYGTVRVLNQANTAKYQDISVDVNGYINFSTVAIQTTLVAGTGYWNLITSLGPLVGNSQVGGYYFSSSNNATSGSQDTGIYRIAAGQLTVGNSTKGDTSGSIVLSNLYAGNTAANTVANTTTIKISTNATLYSTINSTAINVGSNTAQFGTAMYVSANGNLTLNGVANLANTVYGWSKVDTAIAVNTYYKIAELPTSSNGTYDHVVIEGLLDDNWISTNKTEVKILFSNRNAFTYRYYLNGTRQNASKILAFLEANSAVSIYYATEVGGASYISASMNITKTIGATVFATPVANTTLPSGTRNFDTANSSYTPLLTIPYSGVPSYSGQNIILANTTTFGGTANNATYLNGQLSSYYTNATNISAGTLATARLPAAINVATSTYVGNATVYTVQNATSFSGTSNNSTYLGGFTWAAPGGVGSGTANTGAFTTLTTTQGNIANTTTATTGQVTAYASMQGGRSYYAYDMNSYAALYEARFGNSSTSTNIPTGMTGNFYWYGMGAGDTSARGFDLLGTSSSQLWFRERSANTWNQVVTANTAHTLNGVITFAANASFTGNATNRIIVGSTTINATTYSGTSNNALYLGGTAAAGYQTTAGLSANVLTLSANLATYVGNSSGTIANITSWITGNAATAYTNAVTVAANATNLSNGTVPTARLGSGTANSTTVLYGNGVWAAAPGGSGSPGGSNTQLQFNDSAAFGGSSSLTFDKTTVVLSVGNSTVNTTINSTSFSGTSNNSTNFNGSSLATIQSQITGNAATAYANAVANAAALYQTTAGLSANVLTLSSNLATYVGNSSGTIANIASWITGNSATAYTNAAAQAATAYTNAVTVAATDATTKAGTAYTNAIAIAANATNISTGTLATARLPAAINVATSVYVGNATVYTTTNATSFSGIANNATNLNGQAASYYTNATNLATGTVPTARLATGTANSTTVLYGNGVWAAASGSGTTAGRAYAFSLINGI